jgi:hypothetical protein
VRPALDGPLPAEPREELRTLLDVPPRLGEGRIGGLVGPAADGEGFAGRLGVRTETVGALAGTVGVGFLPGRGGAFTGGFGALTGTVGALTGTVGVFTGTVGVLTGSGGGFTGAFGGLAGTVGALTGTVGVFTGTVGVLTGSGGGFTGAFGGLAGTVGALAGTVGVLNEAFPALFDAGTVGSALRADAIPATAEAPPPERASADPSTARPPTRLLPATCPPASGRTFGPDCSLTSPIPAAGGL